MCLHGAAKDHSSGAKVFFQRLPASLAWWLAACASCWSERIGGSVVVQGNGVPAGGSRLGRVRKKREVRDLVGGDAVKETVVLLLAVLLLLYGLTVVSPARPVRYADLAHGPCEALWWSSL